jgi:hypothetical protein
MRSTFLIRLRDDQGVAAIIVAICLVAIFGAAVLAIDAGSLWTTRRHLITGTDAAALAAARFFDENPGAVCTNTSSGRQEAEGLLTGNDASSTMEEFSVSAYNGDCASGAGHVRVQARLRAQSAFAGIFGRANLSALSISTAQWGPLVSAIGARPIGICDKSPRFSEWATMTPGDYQALMTAPLPDHANSLYPGASMPVQRVFFEKIGGGSDCSSGNTGAGNWAWLDFDGTFGGNGSPAVDARLVGGYDDTVALTPHDCNPADDGGQDCPTQTGALGNSTRDSLDVLLCPPDTPTENCKTFMIVVYDSLSGTGNNTMYRQIAFLGVVLRGYNKVTGNPGPDSWFDFEFVHAQFTGSVGPNPSGSTPTVHGVQICGVDHDASAPDAVERCAV